MGCVTEGGGDSAGDELAVMLAWTVHQAVLAVPMQGGGATGSAARQSAGLLATVRSWVGSAAQEVSVRMAAVCRAASAASRAGAQARPPARTQEVGVADADAVGARLSDRLRWFYAARSPAKLGDVEELARRYRNREGELFENLVAKYGVEPGVVEQEARAAGFGFGGSGGEMAIGPEGGDDVLLDGDISEVALDDVGAAPADAQTRRTARDRPGGGAPSGTALTGGCEQEGCGGC